ncbi:MAG TPA: ATP-binding cassette domain-containing protein [Ktedonobacteraceae bacterium]|nr:ATP-binding cassette domain-containing protein [Ktedonobacteraceae bacterium]
MKALDDVSFEVQQGGLFGVIGPNGAGKSTLLSLISGAQHPSSGEILFAGQRLERLPPHAIARLGIGRAHQIPRPFGRMTVQQNVLVPAHANQRGKTESHFHAREILETCGLQEKASQLASTLTLLDLKRLEVARALALRPRLLLLDEVAAGLVGHEIDEITHLIASVQAGGVTIVLVEHVQAVIQQLAERVMVLEWGIKIAEGTPKEIAEHPEVIAVYLGSQQDEPATRQRASTQQAVNTAPLLRLEQVNTNYGKLQALRAVDFEIRAGEIVAVLGANGAGKTTLTQSICGLVPISAGKILFNDTDITRYPAYRRARLGIALCHEGRRLFKDLTVQENIELGARYASHSSTPLEERMARVYELFPVLKERAGTLAGKLSGGQQQMVAIARGVVAEPKVLLLDELSLGLAPQIVDQLFAVLPQICQWGVSIVLIEQNIHRSLSIADRAYILERGHVSFSGTPAELEHDETLHRAYFGDPTNRLRSLEE